MYDAFAELAPPEIGHGIFDAIQRWHEKDWVKEETPQGDVFFIPLTVHIQGVRKTARLYWLRFGAKHYINILGKIGAYRGIFLSYSKYLPDMLRTKPPQALT